MKHGWVILVLCGCTPEPGIKTARPEAVDAASAPGIDRRATASAEPSQPAAADAQAPDGSVSETTAVGPPSDMLRVAGGTFTMGLDVGGQEDERPAHPVTLKPFYLDKVEVSQSLYDECVKNSTCKSPDANVVSRFGGQFLGPRKPVTGVSWFDARAYCAFRGKRLPREAEFERAVRGDDGRKYPWGNEAPTHERTVFRTSVTEDVGTHPTGKGPYGHDDLAGNVWEWMEDEYDPYAYRRTGRDRGEPGTCAEIKAAQNELRAQGRQGFTGSNPIPTECERSIRGGAYNYDADGLRSSNRVHHPGNFKLLMTGLRCAKDVAE